MRVPRFRFSVRRMMLAVAIVACIGAIGLALRRRAERLGLLAQYHDQAAADLILTAGGPISGTDLPEGGVEEVFRRRGPEAWAALRASRYHEALAEKYGRASRAPWRPVAVDPPAPPGTYPRFEFKPAGESPGDSGGFR